MLNTHACTRIGIRSKQKQGRSASPQSRMKAPLLTCNAVSFQEQIGNVILRDVDTVQNASYMKSHVFYRCCSLVALSSTIAVLSRQKWQRQARGTEVNTQLPHTANNSSTLSSPNLEDMAKRTMPSDGPYKPGDKVFVWSSPVNANAIASKAWKKERWIRGTVISQEGAMVNVHVDDAVMRVNQSKIRRDHDEWHDVAVPGLDNPEPVPLAVEDEDDYEPDIAEYAEAYLGEQAHWFCQTGKCDVVELFSSNTGLSWDMSRLNMKVGEPIDHKHGWSFNSKTKQYQVWKQLEKLDPEYVLITNPSPNSWKFGFQILP